MNYRRVLVTGVSGLIGKSVVKTLLKKRSIGTIVGLDLRKVNELEIIKNSKFSFVSGNCRDYQQIDSLISKCDGVIHLAAPSSFLMYKEKPRESTINTIESFLNILEAMKKHKVKKIVHASTSAVYEGNPFPYKEDMELNPPDLKALSKKVNEEIAERYSPFGITSIALRPFSVYGESEKSKGGYANVISLFAWAMVSGKNPIVWGDGKQTRDFIHAAAAAEAFCLALEKEIPTQALNVGTGIETSFNEIIKMINEELNTNLKPRYVPVPIDIYAYRLLSDNSKVERILDFKSKISVKQGLRRVVQNARKLVGQNKSLGEKQMYFETLPQN